MINLTIIIPTKDRPDFIKRQLNYYYKVNFSPIIILADASNQINHEKNKSILKNHSKIQSSIIYDINTSSEQAVWQAIERVETKYSVLLPDDDLILKSASLNLIDFLENNEDYSAAHGDAFYFTVNKGKNDSFGKFTGITKYKMVTAEENQILDRMQNYFNEITNINMCIVRTEVAKKAYRMCHELDYYYSALIFGEIIHGCNILRFGKIKHIHESYLLRQIHNKQFFDSMNLLDWLTRKEWSSSYNILLKTFKEIAKQTDDSSASQQKLINLFTSYHKKLIINSNKASIINKLKRNKIFNFFFTYYRHFKLINGSINIKKIDKKVKEFISIVESK